MHLLLRIVFHKPEATASMCGTGSDIPILAKIHSGLQPDLSKIAVSAFSGTSGGTGRLFSSHENVRLGPNLRFPLFYIWLKTCTITFIGHSTNILKRKRGYPLIKQDIVHHVIKRTGLPRTKAEAAVDTVFEGLKQALTAGERIELRGFGVFSVRARKTGIGRKPRTGTEVSIKPGKAVRFKPGKELHTLETGEPAK